MKTKNGRMGRERTAPRFRAALATDGALELLIYGDIVDAATITMLEAWGYSTDGFVSALSVKRALDSETYSKVRVRINSPGGDAFEGMAIHSLLTGQAKPVEVYVDGIAASSASIVAMAGAVRIMGRSAMMMVHDAWTLCCGNSRDMRKTGDTLDKISESIAAAYVDRTALTLEEVQELMAEETWLSAQDCVDQRFATGIAAQPADEESAAMAMAARFQSLARLKRVPDALRASAVASEAATCECDCESCQNGECANCSNVDCEDPNCTNCPMQGGDAENASNLSLFEARAQRMLLYAS